jgi:hypothetical protein
MEMGFELPPKIYCTLIGEYVLSKGRRREMSLKHTAQRRKTKSFKKSDLVDDLFKKVLALNPCPWTM